MCPVERMNGIIQNEMMMESAKIYRVIIWQAQKMTEQWWMKSGKPLLVIALRLVAYGQVIYLDGLQFTKRSSCVDFNIYSLKEVIKWFAWLESHEAIEHSMAKRIYSCKNHARSIDSKSCMLSIGSICEIGDRSSYSFFFFGKEMWHNKRKPTLYSVKDAWLNGISLHTKWIEMRNEREAVNSGSLSKFILPRNLTPFFVYPMQYSNSNLITNCYSELKSECSHKEIFHWFSYGKSAHLTLLVAVAATIVVFNGTLSTSLLHWRSISGTPPPPPMCTTSYTYLRSRRWAVSARAHVFVYVKCP